MHSPDGLVSSRAMLHVIFFFFFFIFDHFDHLLFEDRELFSYATC